MSKLSSDEDKFNSIFDCPNEDWDCIWGDYAICDHTLKNFNRLIAKETLKARKNELNKLLPYAYHEDREDCITCQLEYNLEELEKELDNGI